MCERQDQLSELADECAYLEENEPPGSAETLRTQLTILQTDTAQLKLDILNQQVALKDVLEDSESKKRELEEYKANVSSLQSWVDQTKLFSEQAVPLVDESAQSLSAVSLQHQDLQQVRNTLHLNNCLTSCANNKYLPRHILVINRVRNKDDWSGCPRTT